MFYLLFSMDSVHVHNVDRYLFEVGEGAEVPQDYRSRTAGRERDGFFLNAGRGTAKKFKW